ncbi:MAG: S1 RNA-binding domain-containing protein [Promethearchaeota archaeon]
MLNRKSFPAIGELVICLVKNVQRGYVQVSLEDYAGLRTESRAQGMVHISELSNRWVKNINNIIQVGQRVVLQVLRVNENRGYVDLSLRRVNQVQRTTTMNAWRYATKLEGMLKFFSEKHNMTLEELYKKAMWSLIDKYGDIRSAFEVIKEDGIEVIKDLEGFQLEDSVLEDLHTLIKENITISKINITVEFDIRSQAGNGIELIKEAFAAAKKVRKPKGADVKFSYIGSPIYRAEIEAEDYPTAEKYLQKVHDKMEVIIGNNGTIELDRDELSNSK